MTARSVDDDLLQRFHDGDTSDAESTEVRARLAESEEDRVALSRLEKLSALFAEVAERDVRDASTELDALYARVRAKTAAPRPAAVVDLAARRRARARTWVPVLALAAAAAVLLVFLQTGPVGTPTFPAPHVPGPTPPPTHVATPVEVGSRVLDADFGAGAGTFFQVNGGEGARVAVVWLDDDGTTP